MSKKNPWTLNLASFVVTVIVLIAGICVSYGTLNEKVQAAEKDITEYKSQFIVINQKLDELLKITTEVKTKIDIHMEETR